MQCQCKQCDSSQSGCAWFKESSRYKTHSTSLPQIYITPLALKWVIGQMQNLSKRDSLSEMQLWTQNEGKSESQESWDWLVANRREGGPAAPFDTLTTVGRLLLVPFLPFLFTAFSLFFIQKRKSSSTSGWRFRDCSEPICKTADSEELHKSLIDSTQPTGPQLNNSRGHKKSDQTINLQNNESAGTQCQRLKL